MLSSPKPPHDWLVGEGSLVVNLVSLVCPIRELLIISSSQSLDRKYSSSICR